MAQSYLDKTGLGILWNKIKALIPQASSTTPAMDGTGTTGTSSTWARGDHVHPSDTSKVDKVSGKGLSTNDFTTTLKNKLDGIASGAEVNVQADWSETDNTSDAFIKNKPTIPEGVSPSDTTPSMNGTASVGTETEFARGDHVHPSDTTRVPTSRTINGLPLTSSIILSNGKQFGQIYGVCNDAATNYVKTVDWTSFTLQEGGIVAIKFAHGLNSIRSININSTGAKYVSYHGTASAAGSTVAIKGSENCIAYFIYSSNVFYFLGLDYKEATTTIPGLMGTSDKTKLDAALTGVKLNGTALTKTEASVDITDFTGATVDGSTTTAGTAGLVPAPPEGTGPSSYNPKSMVLTADGDWEKLSVLASLGGGLVLYSGGTQISSTTMYTATTENNGIMSSSDKTKLDSITMTNGKIDSSVLPSFVDDVIEAYPRSGQTELSQNWLATGSASGTVITPETGKIYILMADSSTYATNTQFRWGGSAYVKLNDGGVTAITETEINTICV